MMLASRLASYALLLLTFGLVLPAEDVSGSPLNAALRLLADLKDAVTADGIAQGEAYNKYKHWCVTQADELIWYVGSLEKFEKRIDAELSEIEATQAAQAATVAKLRSQIAQDEAKQKEAQQVRDEESKTFKASEEELMSIIGSLDKAMETLKEEMKKTHEKVPTQPWDTTLVQEEKVSAEESDHVSEIIYGLSALLDSASLPARSSAQLAMLMQSRAEVGGGGTSEFGTTSKPAEIVYKSNSGVQDIVDLIEKMANDAEENLQKLRKKENDSKQAFDLMIGALSRQMSDDGTNSDVGKAKKDGLAVKKTKLEGELVSNKAAQAKSSDLLKTTRESCMQAAADQEAAEKGREKELKALTEGIRLISQSTGIGETSFLQLSSSARAFAGSTLSVSKHSNPRESPYEQAAEFLEARKRREAAREAGEEFPPEAPQQAQMALGLLDRIAKEQHSVFLTQLASKISLAVKTGSAGSADDPFAKVRKMMQDMIIKLQGQQNAEMQEHEFCTGEMSHTEDRLQVLEGTVKARQTDLDSATASSAQLKVHVDDLREEMARLAKEQNDMAASLQELEKSYQTAKADLENGLSGVRKARDTLKTYYGSERKKVPSFDKIGALPQTYTSSHTALVQSPQTPASKAIALMEASMGMESSDSLQDDGSGDMQVLAAEKAAAAAEAALAEARAEPEEGAEEEPQELESRASDAVSQLQVLAGGEPPRPLPHQASVDAGDTVVGILDACEDDISQNLAELETQNDDNQAEKRELIDKNQDMQEHTRLSVEYKTKEFEEHDAEVARLEPELRKLRTELTALLKYYDSLKERCAPKKISREAILAQRLKEIKGLEQALAVLSGQLLLQVATAKPRAVFFLQRRGVTSQTVHQS